MWAEASRVRMPCCSSVEASPRDGVRRLLVLRADSLWLVFRRPRLTGLLRKPGSCSPNRGTLRSSYLGWCESHEITLGQVSCVPAAARRTNGTSTGAKSHTALRRHSRETCES